MSEIDLEDMRQVAENIWEIPKEGGMNVPARVFASEDLIEHIKQDKTLQQAKNVAHLPGIQKYSIVLPDGHQGYGFPVGGVAALSTETGAISPGGVGYDINCGVRMMTTNLTAEQVYPKAEQLANILFQKVPSGLGKGSIADLKSHDDVDEVLENGMKWALENDYAVEDDLEHCEDNGFRPEADASKISGKAKGRAQNQLGSLGSGNHFLEVQKVSEIYDKETAAKFGMHEDQVVVLIHCGSRGLGHQVCSDYLRRIEKSHKDKLERLPDKELAYAPAGSELADNYYRAMCAAINYAWTNRQLIMHKVRECFERIFGQSWEEMDMRLLYDVAHNIAKKEEHTVDGKTQELYVHRKGSTRAFPAGRKELPEAYRETGQPVIIPGSMGASSYVLKGGEKSMETTFGSTAHGAGRLMSRTQAKRDYYGRDVQDRLKRRKIIVKAQSGATIAEEAPEVYKDVDEVVDVSDKLGIGNKVLRTFPMVNIKG